MIAEIKRRSPSAGAISENLDPVLQATAYVAGGTTAISVLTEPDHFGGSLEDLRSVKGAVDVPVLRKDFILDPAQIWESRVAGADGILLIVAALTTDDLEHLISVAADAGLDALVEAHTRDEAETAMGAGARLVGVNNRDLATFVTDLAVAEAVGPMLVGPIVKVAESGVSSAEAAGRMAAAGFNAILVGEAAVRAADPVAFIRSLREAGR